MQFIWTSDIYKHNVVRGEVAKLPVSLTYNNHTTPWCTKLALGDAGGQQLSKHPLHQFHLSSQPEMPPRVRLFNNVWSADVCKGIRGESIGAATATCTMDEKQKDACVKYPSKHAIIPLNPAHLTIPSPGCSSPIFSVLTVITNNIELKCRGAIIPPIFFAWPDCF